MVIGKILKSTDLLAKLPPGLVLITIIQELATGGVKIKPFLHLVGIHPRIIIEPHPIRRVHLGIIIFLSRGTGGEKPAGIGKELPSAVMITPFSTAVTW